MTTRTLTRNAIVAALYAALGLLLPATALANYRLSTALYVLAAWDHSLIPGLALGNALSGWPQGIIDVVMGGVVGLLTAWACSKLGKASPLAVLLVPAALVPLWLAALYHAPYVVVLVVVAKGQVVSAIAAWALMRVKTLRQLVQR